MICGARFAQLFGLLVRSCSDVKDIPAVPARKDKDSKCGFEPLGSIAAIHGSTTLSCEFYSGCAASSGLDLSREETSTNHYIASEEDLLRSTQYAFG